MYGTDWAVLSVSDNDNDSRNKTSKNGQTRAATTKTTVTTAAAVKTTAAAT